MIRPGFPMLLCILGVFCSAFLYAPNVLPFPQATKSAKHAESKKEIEFLRGNSGEISTPEDIHLGFTDYKSTDGINLRVFYEDFGDTKQAAQALDKEIGRAARIIKRSAKVDGKGRVVGERALVTLPAYEQRPSLFVVMWTDGRKYHEIRSRSLRHALELEGVYKY